MKYILTYGEAPPDAEPIAITHTIAGAQQEAVKFLRDFYPDLAGDKLLLVCSFVYDTNNWVRDPFGDTMYCNVAPRTEDGVDPRYIDGIEMSFILHAE